MPKHSTTAWRKASQLFSVLLYVLVGLLTLRFVLLAISASSNIQLSNFIYKISAPLAAPFSTILRSTRVSGSANNVLEWSTLLAMIVLGGAAWTLIRLFNIADKDNVLTDRYYNSDRAITYEDTLDRVANKPSSNPKYFDDDGITYYNSYSNYSFKSRQPRL